MSKGNKPTRDDKKTMKKKVVKPESDLNLNRLADVFNVKNM